MFYTFGLLSTVWVTVHCAAVQFQYDSVQCLGGSVEYQCTVYDGLVLEWRVLDEEDSLLPEGSITYISSSVGGTTTIGNVFNFEQLPSLPTTTVSNISFTVESSINEYTIICQRFGTSNTVNNGILTIQIPGIPSAPKGIIIHNDTFTSSSVDISWTEPSSPCVTGYRYNVSSTAPGWVNIIMESTSNSVTVEGLVPSDDQYCVVVSAIDTANRTSNDSDPACFIFNGYIDSTELSTTDDLESSSSVAYMIYVYIAIAVVITAVIVIIITSALAVVLCSIRRPWRKPKQEYAVESQSSPKPTPTTPQEYEVPISCMSHTPSATTTTTVPMYDTVRYL